MQFTIVLFILGIIINTIITMVLISKKNLSHKLLKEIKTGVQNMVNEIENKITLAMDIATELKELLQQVKKIDKKIFSQDSSPRIDPPKENKRVSNGDDADTKEIHIEYPNEKDTLHNQRKMIIHMLSQNYSTQLIAETLHVSVEEVNIIKSKEKRKK